MATRIEPFPFELPSCCFRTPHRSAMLSLLSLLSIFLTATSPASAQTSSQQYVYASAPGSPNPSSVAAFSKTSATGALNLVPGSPFSERLEGGLLATDGQGKFLFVLNPTSDDISMFQLDQASGALSEVPGSPFAVPTLGPPNSPSPSQPISVATERSGQFVFVGYLNAFGTGSSQSLVSSLAIDTSGSSPVLRSVANIFPQTGGSPIQLFTDSRGLRLYVGVGVSVTGIQASGPEVYSIDGAGNLLFEGTTPNPENNGFDYAIDPQDRFVFAVGGLSATHLLSCIISPVDGTANTCGSILDLPAASGMLVERSGHFLYIPDFSGNALIFSVDPVTGAATQVGSVPGISLANGKSVADPMGPYIYSGDVSTISGGGIHAYFVDQQSGNLTEIPGSPFNPGTPACCQGLAITGNPVQAASGPAATIFPSTAVPFTATAGTSSATQIFSIVNVGNQLLSINSISIAGTDSSSFSEKNTCLATLAPNAHCSVSINFNPATAGTFTATFQVADNAPGSPQTLSLSGNGLTPTPAVSLSASLSFPQPPLAATTEGTSSAPQVLTVFSTGNATLHIAGVSLAGPNPSDFSFTNNCTAPVAPTANCTISIVFSPIAPGQRTASLMFSDDAPGSPQSVSLSGTAVPAFSVAAASGSSTTASVSAGQTAQYQLQMTPGTGFSGTVSLRCSGAPLAAVCQVPPSISLANGAATPFTVTVTTSGPALLPPPAPLRLSPISKVPLLPLVALALLLLISLNDHGTFDARGGRRRFPLSGILAAAIFSAVLGIAGCGGGSTAAPPLPPVVTPSGTSTISVTPGATSSSGQALQLQPIQLMLTVQ